MVRLGRLQCSFSFRNLHDFPGLLRNTEELSPPGDWLTPGRSLNLLGSVVPGSLFKEACISNYFTV